MGNLLALFFYIINYDMKTVANRTMNSFKWDFAKKVTYFMFEVNKEEDIIFITESIRSQERQNELYKLWLSQVKHSNHQDGLAFDIWFYWKELYPRDFNKWRHVADIAKKYWIDRWYNLRQRDKPHFQDNWQPILYVDKSKMSKYTEIMQTVIKETWFDTIFDSHEWDNQLTEKETKELIEIAFARFAKRLSK